MWVFYLVACCLAIVSLVAYIRSSKVAGWEFVILSASAFAMAGIFHFLAYYSATADVETWSGSLIEVVHRPKWVSIHHHTVSNGKTTTTYTYFIPHDEYWYAADSLNQEIDISESVFDKFVSQWKERGYEIKKRWGSRPDYFSGDHYDYYVTCPTEIIEPTTAIRHFENRVKAGPTAFQFSWTDPQDSTIPDYPENSNRLRSDRVIGTARSTVDTRKWDILNAKLGPSKFVNLILVGTHAGPEKAQQIRSKWIGGKKNDLVMVFGGPPSKPSWVEVFGWTESELCKANLRTILLTHPIDNSILPLIEKEVRANYTIKDWSKFEYINIEPPLWSYLVFVLTLMIIQAVLYFNFFTNERGKKTSNYGKYTRTRRYRS